MKEINLKAEGVHLSANLMLMNNSEHYGVTDVDWDPTGRYVTTSASVWTHKVRLSKRDHSNYANMLTDGKRLPHLDIFW